MCVGEHISLAVPTHTDTLHSYFICTNLSEKQQQQQQQRGDNGECESLLTNAKCIKLFKVLFANMQINIESAFVLFLFCGRQDAALEEMPADGVGWARARVLGMPCRKLAWQLSSAQLATHGWQFETQSSFAPDGHRSTAQLSLPTHTLTYTHL